MSGFSRARRRLYPIAKSTSSFTFNAMMIAATSTASALTHRGAASTPIFLRSAVKMIKGTIAKGS